MSLLIVIPVDPATFGQVRTNLELAYHLEREKTEYSVLFVHPKSFEITLLKKESRSLFKTVKALSHDDWVGVDRKPGVENLVWQAAARHIESDVPCKYWFWWEPDACPLRKGWMRGLEKSHKESGKTFTGNIFNSVSGKYLDRCAIWPKNISEHVLSSGALWVMSAPFDRVAARDTLGSTNETDILLASDIGAFSISKLKEKNPNAGLLRGAEGHVQDILLGRWEETEESDLREHPSFLEQTLWKGGIFAFPSYKDRHFFNCSVAMASPDNTDSLHLFTRRFQYLNQYSPTFSGYRSDLSIWKIRPSMTLEFNPIEPRIPGRHLTEQWEDPRAMVHEGITYVSFCNWCMDREWKIRQSLTRLSSDWSRIEVVSDPDYGGNASDPLKGTGNEKNWAWFMKDERWHCVYRPSPHTVFRMDEHLRVCEEWVTDLMTWAYGVPCGGTPPIPYGDEYLSFFHSALSWRGSRRRYFMGAYTFENKPPFKPTRISDPILVGSEYDFRVMDSPLVIFPQGLVRMSDEFLITFGVNDENCGWLKIPIKEMDSILKPLN